MSEEYRELGVSIPIGPFHPALKEPIGFRIWVEGEKIVKADIRFGHNYRGIELIGARRNWIQILYLAERICGICSWSHQFPLAQAIESLMDVRPPDRANYIRVVVGELERIHSHMLWLGVLGHEIGFDTLLHLTWGVREKVMDALELISGNRVNYAMATIGGVRRDITEAKRDILLRKLDDLLKGVETLRDIVLTHKLVLLRTEGVGRYDRELALRLCLQGPMARMCGIRKDVRQDEGVAAYGDLGFRAIVARDVVGKDGCDAYSATAVRVAETIQSINLVRDALMEMPPGPISAFPKPIVALTRASKAEGEAIGRYEAPRGEVIHYVRAAKSDKPKRWKVRAPSLINVYSTKWVFPGHQIADAVVIAAQPDPCIACTERALIVDLDRGERRVVDHAYLTELSRRKSKEVMGDV